MAENGFIFFTCRFWDFILAKNFFPDFIFENQPQTYINAGIQACLYKSIYKSMLIHKSIKKRAYIVYALNNEELSYHEKRLFVKLKTKK